MAAGEAKRGGKEGRKRGEEKRREERSSSTAQLSCSLPRVWTSLCTVAGAAGDEAETGS